MSSWRGEGGWSAGWGEELLGGRRCQHPSVVFGQSAFRWPCRCLQQREGVTPGVYRVSSSVSNPRPAPTPVHLTSPGTHPPLSPFFSFPRLL